MRVKHCFQVLCHNVEDINNALFYFIFGVGVIMYYSCLERNEEKPEELKRTSLQGSPKLKQPTHSFTPYSNYEN